MKRKTVSLILFLTFFLFALPTAVAVNFPEPVGFFNDFAGLFSTQQNQEFESALQDFERETSNEVVVVITPTFEGLDRFTYSQELFTAWGIGKKNKDNGVLFLIGPQDGLPFPERGEAFINVGKGLEGALTDSITGSILRKEIFPFFKDKKYYWGVRNGVAAIMQATRGEYTADPAKSSDGNSWAIMEFILSIFVMFGFDWLAHFFGKTKSWWLGGVIGGAVGTIFGFWFMAGLAILIPAIFFAVAGLVFDYSVSKSPRGSRFWFLGGGGGRFGGGGGFGGFGGGGSGGGGAGGSW